MKKEVEIKVRVTDFEPPIKTLENSGCKITSPVTQDDMVFVNYDGEYTIFPANANYLRIRKTKDKSFFTLKRGSEMDSIEREVEISDPLQMRDALLYMGYHEVVQVKKIRRKTKFKEYEICFDDVEGLGNFVEVEKMTSENSEKVQNEMIDLLANWGIDTKERVFNGYDTLMYLKQKDSIF